MKTDDELVADFNNLIHVIWEKAIRPMPEQFVEGAVPCPGCGVIHNAVWVTTPKPEWPLFVTLVVSSNPFYWPRRELDGPEYAELRQQWTTAMRNWVNRMLDAKQHIDADRDEVAMVVHMPTPQLGELEDGMFVVLGTAVVSFYQEPL